MALCTHTYADGKTCPRQAVTELRCEFHSPSYTIIRFTRDARHIALEFGHTGTPYFIAENGGFFMGTVWPFPNDEARLYLNDGSAVVATEEEYDRFRIEMMEDLQKLISGMEEQIHAAIARRDVAAFAPHLKRTKGRKIIKKMIADPRFTPEEKEFLKELLDSVSSSA